MHIKDVKIQRHLLKTDKTRKMIKQQKEVASDIKTFAL